VLRNVGSCIDVDVVHAEACAGITRSLMAASGEFYAFSCASADREVNMEMEREGERCQRLYLQAISQFIRKFEPRQRRLIMCAEIGKCVQFLSVFALAKIWCLNCLNPGLYNVGNRLESGHIFYTN
jgi:hypothetical protein